jgi:hypothetical protein
MALTAAQVRQWLKQNPQHLGRVHDYLARQGIAIISIDDDVNVEWGEGVTAADRQRAVRLIGERIEAFINNPPQELKTDRERIAELEAAVAALEARIAALEGGGA